MPQRNMRSRPEPAIANVKASATKFPSVDIAAGFGRRLGEPAVMARTLKRAIAFIDRNVDDLGTLLASISPQVEPILLSDDEPAPRQMVRAVNHRADLDAIHVIAHGRPGEVSFGAGALSLDTTEEHAADLAEVGRRLRGGAIYLWACETARGRRGAAFVDALTRICGVPIAASTQRVGAAARGGQWQLDARLGRIRESAPLTTLGVALYAGVMAAKAWKNRSSGDDRSTASDGITSEVPAADDLVVVGSTFPSAVTGNATLSSLALSTAGSNGNVTLAPRANQTLEIRGTDTGSMTVVTSDGPALSLSTAMFTDTGLTTSITSGGQTKDNTLALTGTVSEVSEDANAPNLVQIYDGTTLLGAANFTAESWTNWGFVTPALADGIHSLTAKVTDNAGNTTTTSAVTVTVDATPPSVKSVSSRVSGSVKTGQVIKITFNMSEKVFVSGTPGLLLNDGGTATYASGSGTQALTFEYIVPTVQGTSDLQVIGDTLPSPSAIQDLLGNPADLSTAKVDLHLKVGSTTTTPATSLTLTGIEQAELFGPSSVNVTFASGATGTLILDASSQFTGTISGLSAVAPFNAIDLVDIAFGANTTLVYLASSTDAGTLTVSDGTHTANIALSGQYGPTSFTIASDGHGGTTVVDPVNSVSGSWSGVFSWPIIGIQSLVLPDGKILTYGTDQGGHQGGYKIYDVWDPVTNTHNTLPNKTLVDEFCAAAEIIPTTGEVIITGGDARPLGSVNNGIANTNIFDYKTDSLTPNPSGPMAFARWYPTLITLGTGQLLILGGRDLDGNGIGYPEIFTPGAGWRTLTGAYIADIANGYGWYYPRAWQASNGKVIAAAGNAIYAIDPSGNGQVSAVGQAPVSLNWNEPAIMFAQDRCLILGADGSVWVMDISGPTPVFTQTGSLAPDRIWSNLTVLPDGRVMVSGGSQVDNQLTGVEYAVAIWNPSTGLWTSTGANAAVPRLYHSTAILLPDATVLSLGGGGLDPDVPSMNHLNSEIYTPGYLFDASGAASVRPVIQQAPLDLSPGQTFTVRVDNPANIKTLALMPFGTTTHSFNTTARRIELSFFVQADGSLSVTLPVNSNVVPPGDWMLFAIGNNGTPSVASTVHVNPYLSLSNTIGTDSGLTATITSLGITHDNTLALSGTVSDAHGVSSVQVYDGATLLGLATISAGNWSYTTAALVDGSHSFTAKATDNAGNTTTTSAVTATVDTTPPTETISTTITTDTGATPTISSGGVTKDNTLALSGTVSDAGGVSSVQIYDGATLLGPALITGGYTAGYAFNESSGTTTADATGHGITGTLVNGATFTTAGKYGNAVALDGVNDYVDLGNSTALKLTGSMTVSAWIYATAFPSDDAAVVSNKPYSGAGFQLDTTVDTGRRTIGFKLTNSAGGDMIRYGTTTLQPNTWYNIVGVYDAAAQTLHVYLNGQLDDGQLVGTVTATQQSSALDVEIGQRPGNPGVFQFNGRIDDVRIADHAITQSQIQTDMATPLVAGGWSYTTAALLDGSHSFTAKATDSAGNTTTTS
ncbi:DUF4347 domain-containing protein, partial [Bradyrhizobium hipponense]|uniref:DUF4347 domain-containing protein n=1 Tax=Bradyrhizobium hipponense TaxID=2605638 RepID=UPI001652B9DE